MRILILVLVFSSSLWAQGPYDINRNQSYTQFTALKKAGNHKEAFNVGFKLIDRYYTNTDLYFDVGISRAALPQESLIGVELIQTAYDMEPIYDRLAQSAIAYAFFAKDLLRAKQLFWEYSYFPHPPEDFKRSVTYLEGALDYYKKSFTASQAQQAQTMFDVYKAKASQNMMVFWEKFNPIYSASSKDIIQKGPEHYLKILEPVKQEMNAGNFPVSYYNVALETLAILTFWNNWQQAHVLIPELKQQFLNPQTAPMMKFKLYDILSKINEVNRNYEENITLAVIMRNELPQFTYSNSTLMLALNNQLFSLVQLERYKEAFTLAKSGQNFIDKVTNPDVKMNAYYNVSRALAYGGDKEKGLQYAEAGVNYMKQNGYTEHPQFGKTLPSNLQSLKFYMDKSSAIETNINSTDIIELYDYGLQLGMKKEYAEAVPFYEKAFKLQKPKVVSAKGTQRTAQLDLFTKIGGNLIACLFESNQKEKIFAIMEELKANGLLATQNQMPPLSLSEIQSVLEADEALIYYVDVMRGNINEGVYMAAVITKNDIKYRYISTNGALMRVYVERNAEIGAIEKAMAQRELRQPEYTVYRNQDEAGFNQYKNGEFVLLAELYRNFLNPNEGGEVREEYTDAAYRDYIANSFYTDLFSRIEPWFKDKKRIYIAADAVLHFLPFESFKNAEGRYLVEDYEIGYIPAGSTLVALRKRPKTNYEKNVLAFGDAKYQKRANSGRQLKSAADIKRLELDVEASLQKNEPLDYAFATFSSEAMNYLEGAKAEVLAIKELVPKTDLRLDTQMTENEFKKMSREGALHHYRSIHLSSHAVTHPFVFNLSGIAFSVYSYPKDGEDGMLTVKEMAQLDIKTDFMFLSACQTGLGKLVPGDGVQGLNQAMLMAGANSTLTTLWSVNDYGTSIYTKSLYYKIFQENKDYLTASTEVKREFINGVYNKYADLSSPQYWAPFIYTGK